MTGIERPMIQQITIRNFKSIGEANVDLSPVTVLIGRSGVGKSNFLRAIRFLRNFLLQGDAAVEQEGGWPRIWPFGTPAPLSFSVRFEIPGYHKAFVYDISWTPHPQNTAHVFVNASACWAKKSFLTGLNINGEVAGEGVQPTIEPRIYLNSFPTLSEAVLAFTAWTTGIGWHDFPANVFAQIASSRGASLFGGGGRQSITLNGLDDSATNYLEVIRHITQDLRDQAARRQILARLKQINPTVDSLELDSIIEPTRVVVAHKVGDRRIGLDLIQE